jgi:hypothetical protein
MRDLIVEAFKNVLHPELRKRSFVTKSAGAAPFGRPAKSSGYAVRRAA